MLISKFDLYKREWLELVFDDRNKEYGAYELRQHYGREMVRAMGFTFTGIALLCLASVVFKSKEATERLVVVDNTPKSFVFPPVKKVETPTPPKRIKSEIPAKPAQTIRNVPMLVTADQQAQKPIKITELEGKAIGQTTSLKGDGASIDLPDDNAGGGGTVAVPGPDNAVHPAVGLEVMPEPVGGSNAWAKFLNKNLRFPAPAQEEGISGRVILSFIIEKNGSLSNIVVDRPAGHGFDEEALRVLKLAKAWKPGIQNGLPVRVRFSIPINFQALEQ